MSTGLLYRAAADADFRSTMAESTTGVLPEAVEALDLSGLEAWTTDLAAGDIQMCATTCSKGPFTFVCDGTSK